MSLYALQEQFEKEMTTLRAKIFEEIRQGRGAGGLGSAGVPAEGGVEVREIGFYRMHARLSNEAPSPWAACFSPWSAAIQANSQKNAFP